MSNEPADGAQKTSAMGITGWMAFLVAALSASLLILSWLVVLIVTMSVGGSSLSLTLDRGVIYGETVPFSYSTPLRFEKVSRHDLGFHSRFTNPSFASTLHKPDGNAPGETSRFSPPIAGFLLRGAMSLR